MGRVIESVAEVIMFQEYKNTSNEVLEGKFVRVFTFSLKILVVSIGRQSCCDWI
jgi:hypothetical protein